MIETINPSLPYLSVLSLGIFFFYPQMRRQVVMSSALLYITLTSIHAVEAQSIPFTRFLIFNFLSVIPVTFLSFFAPIPFVGFRILVSEWKSGGRSSSRIREAGMASIVYDATEKFRSFAAKVLLVLGLTLLIGGALVIYVLVAISFLGKEGALVSLYFILPLFDPAAALQKRYNDAIMGVLLYFFSAFGTLGFLAINKRILHIPLQLQEDHYLRIWPGYSSAVEMFLIVCVFTILFQLYHFFQARSYRKQAVSQPSTTLS